MLARLRDEWARLLRALRTIDPQTAFVLTLAAFSVVVQHSLGSRAVFWEHVAASLPSEWRQLAAWGWWFGMQGVLGFVIPVACLLLFFDVSASDIGLGRGNWRLALLISALYLPLVLIGTWVLSDSGSFQEQYPHFKGAALNWNSFLMYEALFLFYWIGWEYLWRGFVLFGTIHTLGLSAIFVQALPFAALHVGKPWPEAVLSVVGGIALGALCWRCRSFWIAVPIHAAQMLMLDFWCTLRIRSEADGIGWEALSNALSVLGG